MHSSARVTAATALAFVTLTTPTAQLQTRTFPLTVDSIMRGPALVGYPPTGLRWSGDSAKLYFEWRRPGEDDASTYVVGRDGGEPADGGAKVLAGLELGGTVGAPVEVLEDLVREIHGELAREIRVEPPANLPAGVVLHVECGVHGVPPWAAGPTMLAAAAVPRTFSRSAARARDRRDMTVPIGTRRMAAISL